MSENGVVQVSRSKATSPDYGQAVKAIGAGKMEEAVEAATPGIGTQFVQITKQDFDDHPGKYLAAGAGVALSIYDPPATVGAAGRALVPLALSAWDSLTEK